MYTTFVTLWLQVVQPLANVHETKWTPHVKRETDVAQSYTSSGDVLKISSPGNRYMAPPPPTKTVPAHFGQDPFRPYAAHN